MKRFATLPLQKRTAKIDRGTDVSATLDPTARDITHYSRDHRPKVAQNHLIWINRFIRYGRYQHKWVYRREAAFSRTHFQAHVAQQHQEAETNPDRTMMTTCSRDDFPGTRKTSPRKPSSRKPNLLILLSLVGMLVGTTSSTALGQEEGPPPLLQGGLVKQLRTLTQDAISNLERSSDAGRGVPSSASVVDERLRPSANYPRQPTGRTVLRRTHASPWIERLVARRDQNRGEVRESSRDAVASQRVPAETSVQPARTADMAEIVTAGRLLDGNESDETVTEETVDKSAYEFVHVESQIPARVRNSLKSTSAANSETGNRQDGRSGGLSSSTTGVNRPPKVARIPLPSARSESEPQSTTAQGNGADSKTAAQMVEADSDVQPNSTTSSSEPRQADRRGLPSGVSVPTQLVVDSDKVKDPPSLTKDMGLPTPDSTASDSNRVSSETESSSPPQFPSPAGLRPTTKANTTDQLPSSQLPPAGLTESPARENNALRRSDGGDPTAPRSVASPSGVGGGLRSLGPRTTLQSPHVEVSLNGPSDLAVGEFAEYEIVVVNQDRTDLSGLRLVATLPVGVEAKIGKPELGKLTRRGSATSGVQLSWSLPKVSGGETAVAAVELAAQQARNFAVALEWSAEPLTANAQIQVRAPNLEVALEGPSEVTYGEANTYRLHLRNTGNAAARDVVVKLTAGPYGDSSSQIGSIAAGAEEVIDVELTFKTRGSINIAAEADGQPGLTASTAIDVLVRKAELTAELAGPSLIYHGTESEYLVRLRNTGDAPAKDVQAALKLPEGTNPVSLPTGMQPVEQELRWSVDELAPNAETEFPLALSLTREGQNLLQFICSDSNGNEAQAETSTVVEAVADLTLLVSDPVAPAPVGDEVAYELELTNRGSKAAVGVKVIAQFSAGIEPTRGVGHPCRVVPGQVFFEEIPSIPAGETVRLKVLAQAEQGGMHRFRTEVRALDSDLRLVQEESTRYLNRGSRIAQPPQRQKLR